MRGSFTRLGDAGVLDMVLWKLRVPELGIVMIVARTVRVEITKHVRLRGENLEALPPKDALFALHLWEVAPWSRLSVNSEHGLMIDAQGRARSWGGMKDARYNELHSEGRPRCDAARARSRLGHNDSVDVRVPRVIAAIPEQVVCVSAGDMHSLVVTASGDLYFFGIVPRDHLNYLGLGQYYNQSGRHYCGVPRRLNVAGRVARAVAGRGHSACVTRTGELWMWASPERNWTIAPLYLRSTTSPTLVPGLPPIKDVAVALVSARYGEGETAYRTVAITKENAQLIMSDIFFSHPLILSFDPVPDLADVPIAQVAVSGLGTGHRSLAVAENGALYTWGDGTMGALGHGSLDDVPAPRQVHALAEHKVVQVATSSALGSFTSHVLTDAGLLFSWGTGTNIGYGHRYTSDADPEQHGYFTRVGAQQSLSPVRIALASSPRRRVTAVACGGLGLQDFEGNGFNASGSALLDDRGDLWRWGCGDVAGSDLRVGEWHHHDDDTILAPVRVAL